MQFRCLSEYLIKPQSRNGLAQRIERCKQYAYSLNLGGNLLIVLS